MPDVRYLDSVMHFFSSGFAGLLAYSLTSTISWSWYGKVSRSRSTTLPRERVGRSIFLFSLFSALFAAIGVHVCIDYFFGAFSPL
jgi:hypothetical protein